MQLVKYLDENNLVHPNLHGSRPNHNTSTALIQLYDRWVEEIEEGKLIGVLKCDQSAAFDVCDHSILLKKLKLLGLEESAVGWIRSYLQNRRQCCFVDGNLSSPLELLQCGVPQGSIGGPLLWLCFTCDQPDIIHKHTVHNQDINRGCLMVDNANPGESGDCGLLVGYVDDGAYSYAHSDPKVLSDVLSEKYSLIEDWINSNKLVIDPDKTHLMVMGPNKVSNKRNMVSVKAGQFSITPSVSEKLLGCNLHQSLKWNLHISLLMKSLSTRINGIRKISYNSSFRTKLMVANGVYMMSKLVYLMTVLGGAQKYLLNSLQVQQLAVARFVCGFNSRMRSRKKS